ncbi:MAG: hypothetical protein EOQ86_16310 [Mesorhizobium sp.]|uniref:hypothetical protein n=1 Tax=Mesorhizobium sp. TaxID=1871066 RepID=UPI000FE9D46A|nr:hypothetical protein [Mesorhizobium sp.]RWH78889.1 MAG: hypothetical protein EOQ85_15085 [Mesorhizobium sp.]RWH81439.1 MAG: hypothetical protein EOQ86_16310 [Mesorhizobium sp.]RWH90326.1 MAG: hypothetical protein EOQ87_12225 [Mesorhizobium sp.]RWH97791.1 MAG: hypothetical protein EOQ88_15845 [Mesorhizobium sp.]RWI00350.1 MAG: hypothetical protein EOQ89_19345 [Mesorhizobium sp.]
MQSTWDNFDLEAARLNESRARADIDDLCQTINDTRRLILASRKLLDCIAADDTLSSNQAPKIPHPKSHSIPRSTFAHRPQFD